jgi:mycothiol synthase
MRSMFADPHHPDLRPPPPGFTIRRPTADDIPKVAALFAACSLDRIGMVTIREGDLRARWHDVGDYEDILLVEHPDADPPLVAYAEFHADIDPFTGELDLHVEGRVHPDWTGHGLATFTHGRAEDRARSAAAEFKRDHAVLRTAVVDGDDRARSFFDNRGYVPVRHLLELRLDLHADPPSPSWPDGVTCRTFRPGEDEERLWQAHQGAFADVPTSYPMTLEDFLHDRIERVPDFDPSLILLAEHDDEVVGLAICRAGTQTAKEDGWVRDLGVVPDWRRRGVGMSLLRAAFHAFRERGLTGVGLEVDDVTVEGAVSLYRRAGMRIVRRTDVLEAVLRVPGP